jgi:hypothetical protein
MHEDGHLYRRTSPKKSFLNLWLASVKDEGVAELSLYLLNYSMDNEKFNTGQKRGGNAGEYFW